ncbi:MAG TPA: protease pro-enzyme activation domain-containing protein [Candidatus Elarobacter sp.]|nr:protease pro-enzyme activation domain-containing protein [Candidatus Elarobacter sp.]
MDTPLTLKSLSRSERHRAKDAQLVGPAAPTETVSVTVRVRRRPGAPPLPDPTHMAATSEKRSSISREQFAQQYGASQDDFDRIAQFARGQGLHVGEESIARRTIALSGTVAQMNQIFGVQLNRYETPTQKYRGREGSLSVPAAIADLVEGVFGLDDRQMAQPLNMRARAVTAPARAATATTTAGPALSITALTPPQVAGLYRFPTPLHAAGQTIGLLEFGGGYRASDIAAYFANLGLAAPALTPVGVAGATNAPGANPNADAEVALDIDVAGSVAQQAKIAVYFAPWTEQGWVDVVTTAIHDPVNHPSVLSISWGWPEFETYGALTWSAAAIDAVHQTFAEAALLGVTVLAASGDDGSSCGQTDGKAHVLYPASDTGVTTCGGTTIENVSGSSFSEITWNDNGVTGGGISDFFPLPGWQAGARVPASANPAHNVGRGIPDIAGNADPDSGYDIVVDGGVQQTGGTSATAPLYAGLVALMNARLGQPVGFLNPTLYAVGASVCQDIADGRSNATNGAPGYTSVAGWDACTGLGTVVGTRLLNALVGWSRLGAPANGVLGAPVVARNADGRLEVFVVDTTGKLAHVWQTAPNNGWSTWAPLPTSGAGFSGPPDSIVNDADGRLEVFTMASGGIPFHVWQTAPNNGWSTGVSMGAPAGGIIGSIRVGKNLDGRLEAFGVGSDHNLWHSWQLTPNGGWSAWASLGHPASPFQVGDPRISNNQDGRLEVFALGQDGNVYHVWQTAPNNGWSGWASLGKPASPIANGAPFVGRDQDGRIEVFATGNDGTVYHIWQTAPNNGWSAWAALTPKPSGVSLSGLGAVGNESNGSLSVFTIGNDGSMWNIRQSVPNNGWNPWLFLGEAPPGQAMNGDQIPAVGNNKDGRLEIFVKGTDGAVWHLWEIAPNGPW